MNDALSWKPLVFIGLISYSLYLWHWPLLVLAKYYYNGMEPLSPRASGLLFLAVLLLAVASYYVIERPFRKARMGGDTGLSQKRIFVVSGVAAFALLAIGFVFAQEKGFPARVPKAVAELDRARSPVIPYQECDGKPISMERPACRIGANGNDKVTLVWGDSWAIAWAPALDEVLKQEGRPGILALRSACAPLPGVNNRKSPTCLKRNSQVLDWIRQHRPERVYLIAAWSVWANAEGGYPLEDASDLSGNDRIFRVAYPRTLRAIQPYVKDIVVIGPTPGAPDELPYRLALADWRGVPPPPPVAPTDSGQEALAFWRVIRQSAENVRIIDPAPWFCDQTACRYLDAGELLYRDSGHLNAAGARFVARRLLATGNSPMPDAAETAH